jgi:acyl carrier protein
MQTVITEIQQRFGCLHGVLHAAAITGDDEIASLSELSLLACERQFYPKVRGTRILADVLQGQALDFCMLFSSLAAVLGGLGFGAYAAANCFLDAFAARQNQQQSVPWLSVNWDAWQQSMTATSQPVNANIAALAMSPEEGVETFRRALTFVGTNRLIISTGDLESRLAQWVTRSRSAPTQSHANYKRPALSTAYMEPRNDLETQLVTIWQNALGIEKVGIQDDFFELGGNSLLATQLMAQVRQAFATELSIQHFFAASTIAQFATTLLAEQLGVKDDDPELAALLAEVENLSQDELQRLLHVAD